MDDLVNAFLHRSPAVYELGRQVTCEQARRALDACFVATKAVATCRAMLIVPHLTSDAILASIEVLKRDTGTFLSTSQTALVIF